MGETVKEVLEQCKWLISKGREGESAKLLLPRIAAKRRAANKEKRTRIVFDATPEQYAAFHEQLKRYREVIGNITVAHDVLNAVLADPLDETLRQLAGQDETP